MEWQVARVISFLVMVVICVAIAPYVLAFLPLYLIGRLLLYVHDVTVPLYVELRSGQDPVWGRLRLSPDHKPSFPSTRNA